MPMKLTVKTLDSRNHEFENVGDETTVAEFKDLIADTVGVPAERQRLILFGRVMQDEKLLKEYGVDGKVLHLVQRQPPTSAGPDRLARAEAQAARGQSGRNVHRIQIRHSPMGSPPIAPEQPSPRVRLNLAREMIGRARAIISQLEDPEETDRSSTSEPTTINSSPLGTDASGREENPPRQFLTRAAQRRFQRQNFFQRRNQSSQTLGIGNPQGIGIPQVNVASIPVSSTGQGGNMPAGLAQALSGILQGAIANSFNQMGGQPIAMSVSLDAFDTPNSMDTSDPPSSHTPPSGEQNGSNLTSASSNSNASTNNQDQDQTPSQASSNQREQPRIQYPPVANLADVMAEYDEANRRFAPHWTNLSNILREDRSFDNETESRRHQTIINQVTAVMHFLSHAQHAISDMMIDMSTPPPRVLRARPIILQATQQFLEQRLPIPISLPANQGRSGQSDNVPSSRAQTVPSTEANSSTSADEPATTSSSGSIPTSSTSFERNSRPGNIGTRSRAVNYEVNFAPLIVGIELGPQVEVRLHSDGQQDRQADSARDDNTRNILQQIFQAASSGSSTSASSDATTSAESGAGGISQDTQARGDTQTQPTTATRTRFTTQVHNGPPPFSFLNQPGMLEGVPFGNLDSFDPFLPCHSHHIQFPQRRPIRGRRFLEQLRPRSASVPPRRAQNTEERNNSRNSGSNTSASSPQTPRRQVPTGSSIGNGQFGVSGGFQRPSWDSRQQTGASSQPQSGSSVSFALDPSLLGLLQQLGQAQNDGETNRDDANLMNMLQGMLRQVTAAIGGNEDTTTVSQFLAEMPDYRYEEGESMLTDLLMSIARELTFRDIMQIVLGTPGAYSRLQKPLRNFILTKILGKEPSSSTESLNIERVEVEEAVGRFTDDFYSEFNRMSEVVNLRDDVDYPESLYQFTSSRGVDLIMSILNNNNAAFQQEFPQLFHQVADEMVSFSLLCFSDGQASLERLVVDRLNMISPGNGPIAREWTNNTAIGHLRCYLAGVNVSESVVRGFIISSNDAQERRLQRKKKKDESSENTSMSNSPHGEENFATPRSSPELMETEPVASTSKEEETFTVPPAPLSNGSCKEVFPQELLSASGNGPDMVIGSEGWHRVVPSEWVPVVTRDVQVQRSITDETQGPFSDAYLSTQPAKRRRLASKSKPPSGSVENFIRESLDEAISAVGAQPLTNPREISGELSGQSEVQNAVSNEVITSVQDRLRGDPDFNQEKFPNSCSFLKRKQ